MTHELLHTKILNTVYTDLESILLKEGVTIPSHQSKDFLLKKIFKNFRKYKKQQTGLRLSYLGNRILSKHYENYSYLHEDILTNKILLRLDKQMLWPYYISRTVAIFYSQDDAAWFKLNEQKLSNFVDYI